MNDTYQQLQAAQDRLQLAQDAERARLERDGAAQRQIERETANIEHLQRQARQEAFAGAAEIVAQAVMQVFAGNQAVIAALEKGDVQGAVARFDAATQMWQQYDLQRQQTMATVNQDIQAKIQAARERSAGTNANLQAYIAGQEVATGYEKQLPAAFGPGYALIGWIAQAPDPVNKRIRQGLVYAVMGWPVWDPSPDYDPMGAYLRDQQARHVGFRGY